MSSWGKKSTFVIKGKCGNVFVQFGPQTFLNLLAESMFNSIINVTTKFKRGTKY